MDAVALQQELTDDFSRQLEKSEFPNGELMDRIERMVSMREELERYTEILTEKVRRTTFPAA
jgi:uncharacterized protein YutE (UPF0331/DUF86 family)